jgi:hypothetical protein
MQVHQSTLCLLLWLLTYLLSLSLSLLLPSASLASSSYFSAAMEGGWRDGWNRREGVKVSYTTWNEVGYRIWWTSNTKQRVREVSDTRRGGEREARIEDAARRLACQLNEKMMWMER